jgi:fluoride exporter
VIGPFVAVFVGGGAGALCRYGAGRFVATRHGGAFPLGTFLINTTGCFAVGVVAALLADRTDASLLTSLITTGFLGGYTTFSTYALEGVVLFIEESRWTALVALAAPVAMGIPAAALGAYVGGVLRGG